MKMMKRSWSTLDYVALFLVGLYLLRPWMFAWVNIDFSEPDYEANFRKVWVVIIPVLIGFLLIRRLRPQDGWRPVKVLGSLLGILFSLGLVLVSNFFSSFCGWRFSEPLFIHESGKHEIRKREIDCGAGDSHPTSRLVKTTSIGPCLFYFEEVNLTESEQEGWIKK